MYVRAQRDYGNMRVSLTINLSGCQPFDIAVSGNKLFIISTANNIMVADKDSGQLIQPIFVNLNQDNKLVALPMV